MGPGMTLSSWAPRPAGLRRSRSSWAPCPRIFPPALFVVLHRRVDVEAVDGAWEVAVDGAVGDALVVRVLDAVRRSLGDDVGAIATVQLDGHKYQLYSGG